MRSTALIEPVGAHGGMEHYDLGLSRGLALAGWSVSWYTCSETVAATPDNVRLVPSYRGIWGKANRLQRAVRYLAGSLRALRSSVRHHERITHLHFFNGAPEELTLLMLCRLFRRKIVLTVHDVESFAGGAGRRRRGLVGFLYRMADALVVHNQTSRQELAHYLSVPQASIAVIPHGNYLDATGQLPSREVARKRLGLPVAEHTVLFFGQIKQVKGLDLLISAMAELGDVPDCNLLIAGRPWKADFTPFVEQIGTLGLEDRCFLHIRYIPDEEVPLFYAACDVVVLPYRRIYQSGVLLLAMSYGRAVLVADLPGMTETVQHNVNGFVFQSGSSSSLAAKLRDLLADDNRREQMAQNGLNYVATHHCWALCGKALSDLYTHLLGTA